MATNELSGKDMDALLEWLDPVFWGERHFWIPDRRDPKDGAELGTGPIVLHPYQQKLLREALKVDLDTGYFKYTTILWSEPKKSGKTAVAAMVASWVAHRATPWSEIYCIANDGKQSADRVLASIKRSIDLSKTDWGTEVVRVTLPTNTFIEAIPVDPSGEAGSQPLATFWSELWGFRLDIKERLWTELTIPPTRYGRAIRWVESYAGYTGESKTLEKLYNLGVNEGVRHPDFPDLPVYVNERAKLFCYWSHKPRMPWQTDEYYQQEAATLTGPEFRRIHRNEWVDSEETAIPLEAWDACRGQLPPVEENEPLVIALDASVSGDYTALVVASPHPDDGGKETYRSAIRSVEVWEPPKGKKIDYNHTLLPSLENWCLNYNVVCVVYDPFQLEHLANTERVVLGQWFAEFPQGKGNRNRPGRLIGDKAFYDMVIIGQVVHDGNPTLREHVRNAAGRSTGAREHLRFVKKADYLKIDALIAAAMACFEVQRLNLG